MQKDFPDHHDADLILRAYELRREPVLRDARRLISFDFWPKSLDDLLGIAEWDHPQNEAFRQVSSYWELVYGMARHGIVQAEYMAEASGGEAMILLAKVEPFLAEFREKRAPNYLGNTEWIATQTEFGRTLFARLKQRVNTMRATR
jgi:hypothetical protein